MALNKRRIELEEGKEFQVFMSWIINSLSEVNKYIFNVRW